jgi:hypothetical protein
VSSNKVEQQAATEPEPGGIYVYASASHTSRRSASHDTGGRVAPRLRTYVVGVVLGLARRRGLV